MTEMMVAKIEILYEKSEADLSSTDPEELKKALHAGQIPEAYASVIQSMKLETVRRKVLDEKTEKAVYMAVWKKCGKRQERDTFVKDPERNLVYCPAGEILR